MRSGNQSNDLHQLQGASGFKFVGGPLCLDFVNTVGGRIRGSRGKTARDYGDTVVRDQIVGYEDLVKWAQLAALLTPSEARSLARRAGDQRKQADAVLARSIAFREALYRIFKSAVEGWAPKSKDMGVLGRELAISRGHEGLVPSHGAFVWHWEDQALDRVLWPVAKSAVDLLTSRDLARVRLCSGDECGWMFLDTSRNRSRRWCDMRDCGNLAKVRRFRERQARAPKGRESTRIQQNKA
jgi:predicted RNA-binding Zn ribbon-like protein